MDRFAYWNASTDFISKSNAGIPNGDLLPRLKRGYRMQKEASIPFDIYELMRKCWDENPEDRPLFFHMEKQLKFLGSYDQEHEMDLS